MNIPALLLLISVIIIVAAIFIIVHSRRKQPRAFKDMHHRIRGGKDTHYGQYYDLAVALLDGPRTVEELKEYYESYIRLLGFFTPFSPFNFEDEEWTKEIEDSLEVLREQGWTVHEDDRYALTPVGRDEAAKPLEDIHQARSWIGKVMKPENVSKASTLAHLLLAALKLPAAILSGSARARLYA